MSVLQLSNETLHRTVAESECLVVEFAASSAGPGALEELSGHHPDAVFGRIDSQVWPDVPAMFGLGLEPALLIFRQQVVLYSEPGDHTVGRIEDLLEQIRALDMNAVRAEIQEQKRAEAALRMRRVCPTARRGRIGD